jgi:hypothetical protein
MTDNRIDFSALDPLQEKERFERKVRSITAAAGPELAARRARASVFGQVAGWWRPLLAAAAITGIVSIAALAQSEGTAGQSEAEIGVAEAIGMPQQIAQWMRSDELPTAAELLIELETER